MKTIKRHTMLTAQEICAEILMQNFNTWIKQLKENGFIKMAGEKFNETYGNCKVRHNDLTHVLNFAYEYYCEIHGEAKRWRATSGETWNEFFAALIQTLKEIQDGKQA